MAGNIKGITIEIGGNTTKLDKALNGVNSTASDLKAQLKAVNNSLKFNPTNVELMNQKQRILAETIENTKTKLQTLKTAQEQAIKALAEGKIGQEEYDALRREIIKTENQLENFTKQQKVASSSLKKFSANANELGGKLKNAGEKTKGLTAAFGTLTAGGMLAFNNLKDGFNIVISKTGATGKTLDNLKGSFDKVFENVPDDAGKVGEAIGEVNTQFGFMGKALEESATMMLKFAKITESDVTQSTINAKQAMEQFNLNSKDLPMVLDVVAKTAQDTGQSVDSLFDAVIKGSQPLQAMGLNFAESVTVMGQFAQAGFESTKTVSALTKAQVNFAKEGKSLSDGLADLKEKIKGASSEQEKLKMVSEVFGTKTAPQMLKAIKDGKLNFDDLANAAKNAEGAVGETWQNMLKPTEEMQQSLKPVQEGLADFAKTLQELIAPMVKDFGEAIKVLAQGFENFPEPLKKLTVGFMAIVGILPLLLIGIGQMATGLGILATFFTTTSVGIGLASAAATVWSAITTVASAATTALGTAFTFLSGPIGIAIAVITAVITVVVLLIKHFGGLKNVSEMVTKAASEAWTKFKETLVNALNSAKQHFTSFVNSVKTYMANFVNHVVNGVKNAVAQARAKAGEFLNAGIHLIVQLIQGVASKAHEIASKVVNGIKNAVSHAKDAAKEFLSVGWDIVSGIVRGIGDKIHEVANKAREMVRKAIFGARAEADSHSPSRVMIKEGHNFGDGFIVGIQEREKKAEQQSKAMVKGAVDKAVSELQQGKKDISKNIESIAEKVQNIQEKYNQRITKILDDYKKKEKQLTDSYNKELEDRTKSLTSWVGTFDEVPERQQKSGSELIKNLKAQNATFEEWQQTLQAVFDKGLDIKLYEEIKEKGIQGIDYLKAINGMTKEQLDVFVSEWKKKNKLAEEQARIDLKPSFEKMQKDIQESRVATSKELAKASVDYAKGLNDIEETMKKQLASKGVTVGETYVHNFVESVRKAKKELKAELEIESPVDPNKINGSIPLVVGAIVKVGKTAKEAWLTSLGKMKQDSNVELLKFQKDGKQHGVSFMEALIGGLKSKQGEFVAIISSLKESMNSVNTMKSGGGNGEGVSWYAKGGIFNSPSIIGVGEAGTEAVLPINKLDELMANALVKAGGGGSLNNSKLDTMILLLSKLVDKDNKIVLDSGEIINVTDRGLANKRKLAERGL